jgi:protease-4
MLRYSYSRFVGAVAEGRHLSKTDVDAAGRGHVYTGEQAKAVKLIDVYGGLGDAIDEAKKRMGLAAGTKIQLYELPEPPKSLLGTAGKLLGVHAGDDEGLLGLPLAKQLLRGIPGSALVAPEGAQARLPYDISFE